MNRAHFMGWVCFGMWAFMFITNGAREVRLTALTISAVWFAAAWVKEGE